MLKNLLTILQLWKGLTQMSSPDFCLDFCMAAEILHKIPVVYNMFRIRAQFVGLGGGYLRKWNWDLHLIGNGYQPDWLSDLRQGDGFTPPIIGAHARQRTKHGSRQNWFGPILNCSNNVPSNHHLCPFRQATYSIVLPNWVSAAESIIYVHAVPSLPGFIRQRIWK